MCNFKSFFIKFGPNPPKNGKKLGYFRPYLNLQWFQSWKLQIWFSPKYSKTMRQILDILEFYIKNHHWKPQETGGSGGNVIFKTLNFGQILDNFDMKSFPISKISFLLIYLSHMPYWSTIDFISITETLRGRQNFV